MTDMKSVVILAASTGALLEPQATAQPPAVPAALAVPPRFTVSVFVKGASIPPRRFCSVGRLL